MDQQGLEIGAPILQEKVPPQASLIQKVDSESERKIEPEKKKTRLVVVQTEKIPQ